MSNKTIMLMGIPRSGSTLSCKLLNEYKNTLALLEPMNAFSFPSNDPLHACENIHAFVFSSRKQALYDKMAVTKHNNGHIPTNTMESDSNITLRKAVVKDGKISINKVLDSNFTLVIKHNAFFLYIIKDLENFYPGYGIVRNPLSVLCSWNSVDLPVNKGHIPAGEKYDEGLKTKLQNTTDTLERQLIILEWFFEKIDLNIDKSNTIYYENIIKDPNKVYAPLSYDGTLSNEHEPLQNRNSSTLYENVDITSLYKRLMEHEGHIWNFYTKNEVQNTYNQLMEKI